MAKAKAKGPTCYVRKVMSGWMIVEPRRGGVWVSIRVVTEKPAGAAEVTA